MEIKYKMNESLRGFNAYVNGVVGKDKLQKILIHAGKAIVNELKSKTPSHNTGETGRSWSYKVIGDELIIYNSAHKKEDIIMALAIHYGHGTRTGGVVYANPYIKRCMENVMPRILKEVEEAMM